MRNIAYNFYDLNKELYDIKDIIWDKHPDGMDNIYLDFMENINYLNDKNILFFSSFHSNEIFLSQLNVIIMILNYLPLDFKLILPYYSIGTMEKIVEEGIIPTSYTIAHIINNLPRISKPIEVITFDIHTLQNRFYFNNNAYLNNLTMIPVLKQILKETNINNIIFPDYGAFKRFAHMFDHTEYNIYSCNKIRKENNQRQIVLALDKNIDNDVFIVDDLIQSGNTLIETSLAIKDKIKGKINIFAVHGVFPNQSWKKFLTEPVKNFFNKIYISNTNPIITNDLIFNNDIFEIIGFEHVLYNHIIK
jgi:phosphoribosylpyrophosphate synthetase